MSPDLKPCHLAPLSLNDYLLLEPSYLQDSPIQPSSENIVVIAFFRNFDVLLWLLERRKGLMSRILPGTSWSFQVFTICAAIGMIVLLYALIRRRGLKPTMIFFVWCICFFTVKEFLTHHNWFNHIYYINIETVRVFTIPIVIVFGWTFTMMMSLEIGRRVMERIFPKKTPLFLTTAASCIVTASICHLIETMGVANYR